MKNPCDSCTNKYSHQCSTICSYGAARLVLDSLDKLLNSPIEHLVDIPVTLCSTIECKSCPVMLYDYDKRTSAEKEIYHVPCYSNLYQWIIDEAVKKTCKSKTND